jgi:hypothetical protein
MQTTQDNRATTVPMVAPSICSIFDGRDRQKTGSTQFR